MAWFRKQMWWDVEDGWRGWLDTPNSGASAGSAGWETSGTLLNGLGYVNHSWNSHKQYTFEWPDSSSRQAAQFMKSLRDGTYGRGLIHFTLPTLYDQNILPARVADPSMSLDFEGPSLVSDVIPTSLVTDNWQQNSLPVRSVYYLLSDVASGYRGEVESVYVPIPPGYTLVIGAFYSATGTGGVFVRPVEPEGYYGDQTYGVGVYGLSTPDITDRPLTPLASDSPEVVYDEFSHARAVRIWVGKSGAGSASVTLTALCAKLMRTDKMYLPGYGELPYGDGPYGAGFRPGYAQFRKGPWTGGMGHSGVRFDGVPTLVHNTGVGGGQVGYAASFIATGRWG